MGIESAFKELFSESVTLIPPASVDKYGRRSPDMSASVTASAHLVAEVRNVRTPDGRTVAETGRAYLYGVFADVTTDWTILLGSGASPVILTIDIPYDQNGAHHTVVGFGETRMG